MRFTPMLTRTGILLAYLAVGGLAVAASPSRRATPVEPASRYVNYTIPERYRGVCGSDHVPVKIADTRLPSLQAETALSWIAHAERFPTQNPHLFALEKPVSGVKIIDYYLVDFLDIVDYYGNNYVFFTTASNGLINAQLDERRAIRFAISGSCVVAAGPEIVKGIHDQIRTEP